MARLVLVGAMIVALAACVDQELVDEVETKCAAWVDTANACITALNGIGGGSTLLEQSQCDEVNDAAQTSPKADLEAAVELLDCQIAAYDVDCSTVAGGEEAIDAAQACLADFQ